MFSVFQAALLAVMTYASSQFLMLCWSLGKQVQQTRASGLPYCLSPYVELCNVYCCLTHEKPNRSGRVHVMNVAYWLLLAPIVALDGSISMGTLQKWAP